MSQSIANVVGDSLEPSAEEAWILDFAHAANNPLAVVAANLDLLTDMLKEHPEGSCEPVEGRDLSDWVFLASVCVADAREGVSQVSSIIARRAREALLLRAARAAYAASDARVSKRILVVDAYESFARMVERTLRGFEVTVMLDTEKALTRIVDGERFDAIVCELDMPRMRGAELYDAVRRVDTRQADSFVFVASTGESSRSDRPVVRKPFDPSQLRAILAQLFATP